MPNATNITYGNYDFQRDGGPVPLISIVKDYKRSEDGTKIGSSYRATLNGTLTPLPTGDTGYKNIDEMQDLLFSGFVDDCQEFKITCDSDILLQSYPRISSINLGTSNDNWTQTTPYTIELEWPGESYSGFYLDSISETWDLSFDDRVSYYEFQNDNNMYLLSLSHVVSAKGSTYCLDKPAWQEARDWVVTRLGYNSSQVDSPGVFNLQALSFSGWNHSRVQRVGQTNGTFEVTESWLVANTGFGDNAGAGIEDFTVTTTRDIKTGLDSVSINGTIEGLQDVSYVNNYEVFSNKYENASGFWEVIKTKLPSRASMILGSPVNVNPVNYNVGHNPTKGVITYNYQFDNRPCNYITGAKSETIVVNDVHPTDVFAEIAILGRAYGPVLQDLNTVTSSKRSVNISAIVPVPSHDCSSASNITGVVNAKPNVTPLLAALEQQLLTPNTQVFKSQDQENWDMINGQYSRNVEWTYVNCDGVAPNTSFQ